METRMKRADPTAPTTPEQYRSAIERQERVIADLRKRLDSAHSIPECPFPCGWNKLYSLSVEKSAFLARSLAPGDAITEGYREAAVSQGAYLRVTLLALIKAGQENR